MQQPLKEQGGKMNKLHFLIFLAVSILMLLIPPFANAGTFLGKVCFKLTNYSDIFIWNVEAVGEGGFITLTVTGMNTANNRAMSGGGAVIGNKVKLFVGETAASSPTYLGQFHSIVIDMTSPTLSGTDDIVLHRADGTHTLLPGEPIINVPCP